MNNTINEIDYFNAFLLSKKLVHGLEIVFRVFPVKKNAMIIFFKYGIFTLHV